jgi:adenylate kinase
MGNNLTFKIYSLLMLVALTGTPGTGKTTAAKILSEKYDVVDLNAVIKERGFHLGRDRKRNTLIADLKKLRAYISKISRDKKTLIAAGHLSHFLNPDIAIVLRTDPRVLRRRLKKRRFSHEKIEENAEAEMIDAILIEAVPRCRRVYEIDTTDKKPPQVAACIDEIIRGKNLRSYRVGKTDWTGQI